MALDNFYNAEHTQNTKCKVYVVLFLLENKQSTVTVIYRIYDCMKQLCVVINVCVWFCIYFTCVCASCVL